MTVIRHVLQSPTDLVIQGDQLRVAALGLMVGQAESGITASAAPGGIITTGLLIAGDQSNEYGYLGDGAYANEDEEETDLFQLTLIRANGCISTPHGALVPFEIGRCIMASFAFATDVFTISGTTKDKNGSALASCVVQVEETGRQTKEGQPIVAFTTSDGSGTYSVTVPMNVAYQLDAYKTAATPLAGITLNTVVPGVTTDIYLRDPTAADSAGAGSGMSRGRVVN